MNRCLKCGGYVITEKVPAEGHWIEVKHCIMCGWYECPDDNFYISLANRIEHKRRRKIADHKPMKHKYPENY